jgi:hypothetical protein
MKYIDPESSTTIEVGLVKKLSTHGVESGETPDCPTIP